ncbi:MAG: glycosyltransferase [Thermoleophilia bacterium]|nr:glycosyltransferase [Thermoleophilia bacterium]
MHVTLVDPPAFTPPYDHELAAALARAGVDVELVTSRFRFGERPAADGYRLRDGFYPLSARVGSRPLRLALRAFEHPLGTVRLLAGQRDVLHLQWLAAPELDAVLLRPRQPTVFTAHDLLPRRTARREGLWRRLFDRFDRVVVHSERGCERLAAFGVPRERLRVIDHPVFRSDPVRADDGRTVLALGVIRPYKGLPDALAATTRIDRARLLIAGDPRIPLHALRAQAGVRAEWRLGYLGPHELVQALGDATVAVFPYREELDQSGALLQALGGGVPAVVYDVGGLGEVIRRFDAGAVVPPGDVAGLERELRRLLDDPDALARARAGAAAARVTLTWEAAAQAHIALYRELS